MLGCLLGGAIGDAWGSAFEGSPDTEGEPRRWCFTDDTQLTLATCEAILEAGGVQPEVIAEHFTLWFVSGRLSGLGASTLKALRDLQFGAHWALSGAKGPRAAGNGAAMRIAPLAFVLNGHDPAAQQLIRDVCRITHHHDEAYVGALAVLLAVQDAHSLQNVDLDHIGLRLPDSRVRDRLRELATVPNSMILDVALQYGASGFVAESVPLALYAAAQESRLGFEGVLADIMRITGDTDTVASIAGSVMGTALGRSGLPNMLLAQLPDIPELAVLDEFARWSAHP